ncbi:MAG: nucleotidyl transferase AbiEii/AbiGii toxin family protein [Bacteroidales bacterium]|jgi:predicted nucleotidyltransferase component of viral defense system|nr:nucleotidyl transferase AbiEii/AbiGii toxin family protein [Bacteroidales bacterium]MCK9498715.1 nucleotidyl transferase AbiEii/AbiGii toxin family protein [Bacteroidales bacterium]MDY0315911.1 nucleotidyl transferase AbiEii/AbiGii toxin family protein [Bacteroidales bacterium]NLB87121.1 nucleotidyl transferase AbiEii/AbiGii toxin family protein [Bacteroidales bacterium]
MIPKRAIEEWAEFMSWKSKEFIEQDLIICRALCQLYKDEYLAEHLALRGGTTLNKIYLNPQPRYSEDIDLVQIKAEPIKETIDRIRDALVFIGEPKIKQKGHNNTLIFRFESEIPPIIPIRLKVEINTREHFNVLGLIRHKFEVKNQWYSGTCQARTYQLEELLGTKVRALYQRRKGRDLFDLWKVLSTQNVDIEKIIRCYREYINFVVDNPPTQKEYLLNMEIKLQDEEFLGDTEMLLRPDENYNPQQAWELVKKELIEKIVK